MLENESLWEIAERIHGLLARQGIDYAIVGGVAVCLHGYRRNTVDLDLLIRPEDAARLRSILEAEGFQWIAADKEFRSASGVAVQWLLAGEREGPGQETTFPNPGDTQHVTTIEGLPVLSLAPLIQAKLACGLGDMRRTHKDLADVVELIAIHRLDGSFARFLHKSVRKAFRQLVRRVDGES
ncbi:MAG TPA: nucleotidyltransferase family protein [Pirellulales bacterium]|nr:nucleotidyltransferase family protein [Pirellulales bacterium]